MADIKSLIDKFNIFRTKDSILNDVAKDNGQITIDIQQPFSDDIDSNNSLKTKLETNIKDKLFNTEINNVGSDIFDEKIKPFDKRYNVSDTPDTDTKTPIDTTPIKPDTPTIEKNTADATAIQQEKTQQPKITTPKLKQTQQYKPITEQQNTKLTTDSLGNPMPTNLPKKGTGWSGVGQQQIDDVFNIIKNDDEKFDMFQNYLSEAYNQLKSANLNNEENIIYVPFSYDQENGNMQGITLRFGLGQKEWAEKQLKILEKGITDKKNEEWLSNLELPQPKTTMDKITSNPWGKLLSFIQPPETPGMDPVNKEMMEEGQQKNRLNAIKWRLIDKINECKEVFDKYYGDKSQVGTALSQGNIAETVYNILLPKMKLAEDAEIALILKKSKENPKGLTPIENEIVNYSKMLFRALSVIDSKTTTGYKTTKSILNSLPFMADFFRANFVGGAIRSGIRGGTRTAMKLGGKSAAKEFAADVSKNIVSRAGKFAGDIGKAAVQTTLSPLTPQNMLEDYSQTIATDGQYTKNDFIRGGIEAFTENFSERMFGALKGIMPKSNNAFVNSLFGNNPVIKTMQKHMNVGGMFEETAEEYAGDFIKTMFGFALNDEKLAKSFKEGLDNSATTILSIGITVGLPQLSGMGIDFREIRNTNKRFNVAEDNLKQYFNKENSYLDINRYSDALKSLYINLNNAKKEEDKAEIKGKIAELNKTAANLAMEKGDSNGFNLISEYSIAAQNSFYVTNKAMSELKNMSEEDRTKLSDNAINKLKNDFTNNLNWSLISRAAAKNITDQNGKQHPTCFLYTDDGVTYVLNGQKDNMFSFVDVNGNTISKSADELRNNENLSVLHLNNLLSSFSNKELEDINSKFIDIAQYNAGYRYKVNDNGEIRYYTDNKDLIKSNTPYEEINRDKIESDLVGSYDLVRIDNITNAVEDMAKAFAEPAAEQTSDEQTSDEQQPAQEPAEQPAEEPIQEQPQEQTAQETAQEQTIQEQTTEEQETTEQEPIQPTQQQIEPTQQEDDSTALNGVPDIVDDTPQDARTKDGERTADSAGSIEAESRVAQNEQEKQEIINQRNTERRNEDEQTSASTEAIASQAEVVAIKAESDIEAATDEKQVNEVISRIDAQLDNVNEQLALLGYYEAEQVESDFNEVYGYMRNAEKKAVKDANKLAKRLVNDLGIDPETIVDSKGKRRRNIAKANIAPIGGDIIISLPLGKKRELYINVQLDNQDGDNLQANGGFIRVENPNPEHGEERYLSSNYFFTEKETYKSLLNSAKSLVKHYAPDFVPISNTKQEASTKTENKTGNRQKKQKEQVITDLFSEQEEIVAENNEGKSVNTDTQNVENTELHRKFAMTVKSDMLAALDNDTKPYRSILDLRKRARELGIEVDNDGRTDILLQELVEDGLVRAAREVIARNGRKSRTSYDLICKLYEMQPTIAARSSNRIKMQQYSTPLPMAWIANRFAMEGKGNGKVLEPTAGNGMLVFTVPVEQVHANELDETRLDNLREQGFAEVTQQDATEPFEGGMQYDVVIANPPFGKREAVEYDGKMIAGLDPQITLNALASMKDDGRAAIIIGGNMEYASNGSIKSMKPFFTYLYDHYNVKGIIDMSGGLYAKQGTTFPTRMILIEGRRSDEERAQTAVYPPVESKAIRKAESFDDLYDIINEVLNSNEKTNGTEVLRSRERKLVSVDNETFGNTDGVGHNRQSRKNDDVGSRREPTKENSGGSYTILPREHRTNNADGERGGETQSDNAGGSRRLSDTDVQRVGTERVSADGVGLKQTPTEPKKRDLSEQKLPYRPHNSSLSLNSVAPAAMVEAMDNVLTQIEAQHGSIDEYVRTELGYDTVEEAHQALAAEQMDSVAMAIYQMKQGQALIIGDQTGVGKGRQMAALIRWAVKQGEKPIFITQKADLFSDIYRDLVDVGSGDLVPFIFNSDGAMVDSKGNTVHKPLSDAAMKKVMASGTLPDEYDFIVLTYSQVNSGDAISQQEMDEAAKKSGTRTKKSKNVKNGKATLKATFLRAIAKDNYLFLDESHTAAGLSNTGAYLQSIIRTAKAATFASATFAKRPDTMPLYAIRTAMSKAKVEPDKMISIIEKGGVTLQEIMSRELTNAGQMVRRERDMSDVITDWKTITDPETVRRARENYDRTIAAFNAIIKFQEEYVKPMIEALDTDLAIMAESAGIKRGTDKMGVDNVPFASKTYNYTKQLMLALKVDAIVDEVEAEINAGRHPVIALESTMESSIKDYAAGEIIDEPTFSASLLKGLDTVMQYTITDENGNKINKRYSPQELGPAGEKAYYELQDFIRESTSDIFISPLDAIIERLHEKGYKVGELTGRNMYVERDDDGSVVVKRRTDKDKKRMQREFNSGILDVLILNKSASTGISLHASEKFSDQRQRSMIIAQPLSDINDYMQMIGRIDRTGQVHRGYYINLGLPVPAENRFLMMLSTKLKSLNANTTTSQDSESNDVEAPDLLNKYGSQVVVEYLRDNVEIYEKMGTPLKKGVQGGGNVQASELDEYKPQEDDARKITGYVALLTTKEQEEFYDDVVRRYNELIKYLNDTGSNDLKISVMPLRAKTIDRRVSSEGIDPNGSNPFARNSYVEKVEMDVLRKPMKADEIRKVIEQINRGIAPAEYLESVINTIRKEDEARIAREEERYEKAKAKAADDITKQTNKINKQQKRSEEEKRDAIENFIEETNKKVEEKHNNNILRINQNNYQIMQYLRMFEVGKSYLVPDNLNSMTFDFATPAIFCGYKTKDSKITASTTLAVFATLDARRRIEIKLSDIAALRSIDKMTNDNWDAARSTTLDNWDSQIPNEKRKIGFIMTGNILQAIADTQDEYGGYPGQLISYTDIDGNVHDGILMPDKWDASMLKTSGVPLISRLQQIKDYKSIISHDGKVEITGSSWAKMFYLTVPKTKKDGAVYYENKTLLNAAGGNFYPYRGKLRADIPADSIDEVVQELTKLGVKVNEERNDDILYQKYDGTIEVLSTEEAALRDALIDKLREAGIDVITDVEEAQRVLDEANSKDIRHHKVYHGSIADFDDFDHSHMGEGEGNQFYGWGTYVTEIEGIGVAYAQTTNYNISLKRSELEHKIRNLKDALPFRSGEAKREAEEELKRLEEELSKFNESFKSVLYTVEIPDDNGKNYLDYTSPFRDYISSETLQQIIIEDIERRNVDMDDIEREMIERDVKDSLDEAVSVGEMQKSIGLIIGAKRISELLNSLGFVGVSYPAEFLSGGRNDGARNYVIFNEEDIMITDKVRFFRTADGNAYGFKVGGKIYIDQRIATADTPIHEYAHLWASAMQKLNPNEWANIVKLMKGTPIWEEVKRNYPELTTDNEIADEVLAFYSGSRGAERLREEHAKILKGNGNVVEKVKAINAIKRVREALKRFWKNVADWFGIHFTTAEEVADKVLSDLLNGVNPTLAGVENDIRYRRASNRSVISSRFERQAEIQREEKNTKSAANIVLGNANVVLNDTNIFDEQYQNAIDNNLIDENVSPLIDSFGITWGYQLKNGVIVINKDVFVSDILDKRVKDNLSLLISSLMKTNKTFFKEGISFFKKLPIWVLYKNDTKSNEDTIKEIINDILLGNTSIDTNKLELLKQYTVQDMNDILDNATKWFEKFEGISSNMFAGNSISDILDTTLGDLMPKEITTTQEGKRLNWFSKLGIDIRSKLFDSLDWFRVVSDKTKDKTASELYDAMIVHTKRVQGKIDIFDKEYVRPIIDTIQSMLGKDFGNSTLSLDLIQEYFAIKSLLGRTASLYKERFGEYLANPDGKKPQMFDEFKQIYDEITEDEIRQRINEMGEKSSMSILQQVDIDYLMEEVRRTLAAEMFVKQYVYSSANTLNQGLQGEQSLGLINEVTNEPYSELYQLLYSDEQSSQTMHSPIEIIEQADILIDRAGLREEFDFIGNQIQAILNYVNIERVENGLMSYDTFAKRQLMKDFVNQRGENSSEGNLYEITAKQKANEKMKGKDWFNPNSITSIIAVAQTEIATMEKELLAQRLSYFLTNPNNFDVLSQYGMIIDEKETLNEELSEDERNYITDKNIVLLYGERHTDKDTKGQVDKKKINILKRNDDGTFTKVTISFDNKFIGLEEFVKFVNNNFKYEELRGISKAVAPLNAWLSRIYTILSPVFSTKNFFRDLMVTPWLPAKELNGKNSQYVIKNFYNAFNNLSFILKMSFAEKSFSKKGFENKLKARSQELFEYYLEYSKQHSIFSIEDQIGALSKENKTLQDIEKALSGKENKFIKFTEQVLLIKFMQHYAELFENLHKFSAYVTLRKLGYGEERSAQIANNATLNYDRSGSIGRQLNAIIPFAKAALGGFYRTNYLLPKYNPKGFLQRVITLAVLGVMQGLMYDPDDDDISEFARKSGMVFGSFLYPLLPEELSIVRPVRALVIVMAGKKSPAYFKQELMESTIDLVPVASDALRGAFSYNPLTNKTEFDVGQLFANTDKMTAFYALAMLASYINENKNSFGKNVLLNEETNTDKTRYGRTKQDYGLYDYIARLYNSIINGVDIDDRAAMSNKIGKNGERLMTIAKEDVEFVINNYIPFGRLYAYTAEIIYDAVNDKRINKGHIPLIGGLFAQKSFGKDYYLVNNIKYELKDFTNDFSQSQIEDIKTNILDKAGIREGIRYKAIKDDNNVNKRRKDRAKRNMNDAFNVFILDINNLDKTDFTEDEYKFMLKSFLDSPIMKKALSIGEDTLNKNTAKRVERTYKRYKKYNNENIDTDKENMNEAAKNFKKMLYDKSITEEEFNNKLNSLYEPLFQQIKLRAKFAGYSIE